METADSIIIKEILDGNKQQYALLMSKYNQRLYRIGKGYLKDESEIEDAMQEAYIKAYQSLSKFENRSEFATWVTRILINECLHRIKKKQKTRIINNEESSVKMTYTDNTTPESESINKELKTLLEKTIASLPEKYRSIFIIREIEKMSVTETSQALNISESNVKIRLNRAKEMLRNELTGTYPMGSLYEFNLVRCHRVQQNVLSKI